MKPFFYPHFDRETLVYPCGNGAVTHIGIAEHFDVDAYEAALADMDFTEIDKWQINGCKFLNMRRDGETMSLCLRDSDLRVTLDPYTAPYNTTDCCEEKVPTTFWMHEVDHSMIDCGMCLIVRCADGSFFVVDGGHFLQTNDNDRIYRFMRSRTPAGQKVRIAGWFISHAHDDHICKFYDFLKYNMDDVELEAVYHNMPDPLTEKDVAGWSKPDVGRYPIENMNRLLDSMPEVKKIRLYTGQRFAVRNLRFTVLCTHADVVPSASNDFNNTSVVLMMEAAGHKALLCGDASDLESDIMERIWQDSLKCDVLQVAHHGHHGCSKTFYEYAQGKIALFANTRIFYELDLIREKEANTRILELADCSYVTSDGTAEVDMATLESRQLPDETFEDFEMIEQLWGYKYTDERKAELYRAFLAHGGKENGVMDRPWAKI